MVYQWKLIRGLSPPKIYRVINYVWLDLVYQLFFILSLGEHVRLSESEKNLFGGGLGLPDVLIQGFQPD